MSLHQPGQLERMVGTAKAFDELPTCPEVEQSFLGLLMNRNDLYSRVAQVIESEHFSDDHHATIWEAMAALIGSGKNANPVTLKVFLGDIEITPGERTMAYLARLCAHEAGIPASLESYAEIIRTHAGMRVMILSARGMIADAMKPSLTRTLPDILREHEDRVERIRPKVGGRKGGFRSMSKIAEETARKIQDEWNDTAPKKRLLTGYAKLDDKIGGLSPPDLIVIAGRPASGKTSLAVDMAYNAAVQLVDLYPDPKTRGCVAIFSAEMSEDQLTERMLSRKANVTGTRIKRRKLYDNEMQRIWDSARNLSSLPIEIDDEGDLAITQILARARALHRRQPIRLMVVDYLQILKGFRTRSNESQRHLEIAEMTAALKGLCKELHIPIILLSQVGRQVDARPFPFKRPTQSDLKESGSIEQDADVIVGVYREETYLLDERPLEGTDHFFDWEKRWRAVEGVAELIVLKTRHGSRGTVVVGFDGAHTTFLPEPPPRVIEPERARETAKRVVLTDHGKELHRILKELASTVARKPTDDDLDHRPQTPRNALLIPREDAKRAFTEEVVPGLDEKTTLSKMQAASDNLRKADLTKFFTDRNGIHYIYLPELIAG